MAVFTEELKSYDELIPDWTEDNSNDSTDEEDEDQQKDVGDSDRHFAAFNAKILFYSFLTSGCLPTDTNSVKLRKVEEAKKQLEYAYIEVTKHVLQYLI